MLLPFIQEHLDAPDHQHRCFVLTQKERAETRCGEALQEMEAMKSDILVLAQQLQVNRLSILVPIRGGITVLLCCTGRGIPIPASGPELGHEAENWGTPAHHQQQRAQAARSQKGRHPLERGVCPR